MNVFEFISGISGGRFDQQLRRLYGASDKAVLRARARYLSAAERFSALYPQCEELHVYSAPGRTEIGGNHTDHQHGCVLAAAVSLDIIAMVSFHDEGVIRIKSEGFTADEIDLGCLEVNGAEKGTSAALVRGIAAKFAEKGVSIGGFDAYITSDVAGGSGLSSSAAFEVLMATIINKQYNDGMASAETLARIGKFAENAYFGKNCGLMDQMVCACGGFAAIDFGDPQELKISAVDFDFDKAGYSVCITDTNGDHADLSDEYGAVAAEMKHVAEAMGCEYLRYADEEEFYSRLPELRETCTDRELLRAAHFFAENRRAAEEAQALAEGDTVRFFELVNESGNSSAQLLQNLYPAGEPQSQPLTLAIMLSKRFLGGSGAVRVHGGGFAGTVQAFVPNYLAGDYAAEMERVFGAGCCNVLTIRPVGGYELVL
ncbi:galactokinase family protein [uncultured Ruminococcus sp.]|uniref:galactokinase n=1 Tax=uncultured Ruminococcus sp. TaxID=165186 RepID=UPI002616CEFC|nr:galactokinase family protein [uncultured Ruminococcus sp.]